AITPEAIDFLLVCTQSPDFLLPPTACLMQDRLGLPTSVGALEFNLGCSGFIYGLSLAQGLIQSGQCRTVLLITAETYSKFIHPRDRSVRTLFGDGAAATLIQGIAGHEDYLGPFVLGTDGAGGQHLSVPSGGARMPRTPETAVEIEDPHGNIRSRDHLFMDGPEIFNFTIRAVPKMVHNLLEKTQRKLEDIDLFCFHQANQYMLEHLRNKLHIPSDRFLYYLAQVGNTVSSTIPITLTAARDRGALQPGMTIMLCGFGVGYSWGATLMRVP
ncbi:MAG TPA: ketoacyl-ACP synthase III, partial [Armatimonadota bacterium]